MDVFGEIEYLEDEQLSLLNSAPDEDKGDGFHADLMMLVDSILSGTDTIYQHVDFSYDFFQRQRDENRKKSYRDILEEETPFRSMQRKLQKVECPVPITKFSEWLDSGFEKMSQWTVDLCGEIYIVDASSVPPDWRTKLDAQIDKILEYYYERYKPLTPEDRKAIIEKLGFKVTGPIPLPDFIKTAEHKLVELDYSDHQDKPYHEAKAEWTLEDRHEFYNKKLYEAGARPAKCGARTVIKRDKAYRLYCGNFRNCPRCFNTRVKDHYARIVDAACMTLHSWYEVVLNRTQCETVKRNLTAAGVYWVNFPMEDGNHMLIPTPALLVLKNKLETLKPVLLTPDILLSKITELCHTPERKRVSFSANFPVNELKQADRYRKYAYHRGYKSPDRDDTDKYGTYIVDAPLEKVLPFFLKKYDILNPICHPPLEEVDNFDLGIYSDDQFFEALLDIMKHYKVWMYVNNQMIEAEEWLIRQRWKHISGSQEPSTE